jgi:hypothetical protein
MSIRILLDPPDPQFTKGQLVLVKPEKYEYTHDEYLQLVTVAHSFSIEPTDTRIGTRLVQALVIAGYFVTHPVTEIEVGPYDSDWSVAIHVDPLPPIHTAMELPK